MGNVKVLFTSAFSSPSGNRRRVQRSMGSSKRSPRGCFVLRILSNLSSILDRAAVVNLAPTLKTSRENSSREITAPRLRLMNNTEKQSKT